MLDALIEGDSRNMTPWERRFVRSLRDVVYHYGMDMAFNQQQIEKIESIWTKVYP